MPHSAAPNSMREQRIALQSKLLRRRPVFFVRSCEAGTEKQHSLFLVSTWHYANPVWCHPWMNDGTDGWMDGKLHEKRPRRTLLYVIKLNVFVYRLHTTTNMQGVIFVRCFCYLCIQSCSQSFLFFSLHNIGLQRVVPLGSAWGSSCHSINVFKNF
jgi:hypothetical protein